MSMETDRPLLVSQSQVMSAVCKLLLATAAFGALIVIFSTRQQNDMKSVSHRRRREIVYPIMVFPSGTVFQVS